MSGIACFVTVLALALGLAGARADAQTIVIRHVTVIDATDHAPCVNRDVVIRNGRIAAIRSQSAAPKFPGALIVDGTGKYLIPGLWDMHVHGASDQRAPWSHRLFLASGVVGVRDMSGPVDAREWRASQVSSLDPSPTIYLGSPIVDGPNPRWPDSLVVATESQARAVVDEQQRHGADFIKVYSRLPRDAYFAIADEAKRRGISFAGHVPESVTALEASVAGQRSIEHLTRIALGSSADETSISADLQDLEAKFRAPGSSMADKTDAGSGIIQLERRVAQTFDPAVAAALFAAFVRNGTWQTPTLVLLRAQTQDAGDENDERLRYLSRGVRTKWNDGYYNGVPSGPRAALLALSKIQFEESIKLVGQMYGAGVLILAGTDAMNPYCFPGDAIHEELALLVAAGLSPLAALQTATRNAARFIGQLESRGTVEVGKIADLVLLDENPLADIHNTRTIRAVVLRGALFRRHALDAIKIEAQTLASLDPAP